MRRAGAWGMAAALIVGLGLAAVRAEEADGDAKSAAAKNSWWSNLLGEKPKPKAKADKKEAGDEPPTPPSTVRMGVLEQKRQMNAILRRMEVCDRLRMVALQSGNEDLMRQADELEARAKEVYRRQTSQLPTPALPKEADAKTKTKKQTAKQLIGTTGLTDTQTPAAKPAVMPTGGRGSMGGDFERRERDLINGTFMGRDKP